MHYNLGTYCAQRGDWAGACEYFKTAVAAAPDFALAWYNLGSSQRQLNQLPAARSALARALELAPDLHAARVNLSLVEFRAGWQQVQRVAEMQARLRHQFSTVDANKNGAIDPGEYGGLLLVKNAGKAAPQMSTFDANKDGKLGFGEYVRLVQTLAPQEAKDAAK